MAYQIKQYDTKTAMRATIKAEGQPVDLNLADEVKFIMRNSNNTIIVNKAVEYIDKAEGKVWFPFEESETSQAGKFEGEFIVKFTDGRIETFPNVGTITVQIMPSIVAITKSGV